MSFNQDNELSEKTSQKSGKRVRFSDEIKDVHEFIPYENHEDISLENRNGSTSFEIHNFEQNEYFVRDSMKEIEDLYSAIDANMDRSTSDLCNEEAKELNEYVIEKIPADSYIADLDIESDETPGRFQHPNATPPEYFDNNNSDMVDLNSLVHETKHMTISSAEQAQEINQRLSSLTFGNCSPGESGSEKIDLPVPEKLVEPPIETNHLSRKRSLHGTLSESQCLRLNNCLKTESSEINSASDLKNTVFNAWYKVKNESAKVETTSLSPKMKDAATRPKISRKPSIRKDIRLKNSKKWMKKARESKAIIQKEKEDTEESKMAFRAWKKKKDELLNQQIAEKCKKEEKKRLDALMNERMRKSDAESAYLAWISHKAAVMKMEKKKRQWLLERENEKLNEKIKRNDEAAKIYYKWLRNKIFSKANNCHAITEDKPPWTPPGKANILI